MLNAKKRNAESSQIVIKKTLMLKQMQMITKISVLKRKFKEKDKQQVKHHQKNQSKTSLKAIENLNLR